MSLDPVIHQATRLRIMAALFRNREASFTQLRDGLGLTDGNMGSHAATLEKAGLIESRRALTGSALFRRREAAPASADGSSVSFEVRYRITPAGSRAFVAYTHALRAVLDDALPEDQHEAGDRREEREDQAHDAGRGSEGSGPSLF